MNKFLHRIVFNAARGMRMVVQETAHSAGKASGATSGVLATALAGLLAVAPAPALAQIAGAPGAVPGLRPTVLVAPHGVPLVNIQTPSAAGVSRNLYNQFDVQPHGVVLNNSRTDVQTRLGGWVQANPFLATGPARIILNEVVSGNPTQLRGAIEVAGQRAEVIVANPAGIAVDGGTFLNASRATLTTGTPQLNALGGLGGYVVRGGTVTIDGAGLDVRSTDYAAILARAVKVNAGLWANELKVVTGANQVSADQAQISPATGTGTPPAFSLDVALLGGMYAGKIKLIGTEAGVGARNAGTIMAADGSGPLGGVGEMVVTAAGRLENIGTLQAARRAEIAAESLVNSGRIASAGELGIATPGTLTNAGGTLEAQSLQLASGAHIDNRGGAMRQTSGVALTVNAPRLSNTAGGVIGAEPVPETPAQPGSSTSNPATSGTGTGTGTGTGIDTGTGTSSSGDGSTTALPSYVPAPGNITAAGSVLNDAGRIYAGGAIQLDTPQVNNHGGSLTTTTLSASGPGFSNAGGTLNVSQAFSASVDRFDNTGGTLRAGSLQIAATGELLNDDGQLESSGDAHLSAGGALNNSRGTLRAGHDITVAVGGRLANDGSITAGRNTTINAASLQGGSTGPSTGSGQAVLGAGIQADGKLGSVGELRVTTTGALMANGINLAAGNASLQGASVDVSSGTTSATNIALTATQGHVTTSGATIATPGTLSVKASSQGSQTLVNQGGKLDVGQLGLSVSNLANTNGGEIVQTGTGATTIATSGAIDNSGGRIATNGQNLTLQAASLTSTGGRIEHAGGGTLSIAGGSYSGANGEITGNGALVVNVAGSFVQDGGSTSAQQITLDAGAFSNQGGKLIQAGSADTRITVAGAVNNNAGTIATNGNTALIAASFNNNGGTVAAVNGKLDLAITGATTNVGGSLLAGGAVVLHNAGLDNSAGKVFGHSVLVDAGTAALDNTQGTLAATTTVDVGSGALNNHAGLIQSGGAMTLDTRGQQLTNTHAAGYANGQGGIASGGTLTLASGTLNNSAGFIGARSALIANTGAVINSAGGLVLGQGSVHIDTHGAGYDSRPTWS